MLLTHPKQELNPERGAVQLPAPEEEPVDEQDLQADDRDLDVLHCLLREFVDVVGDLSAGFFDFVVADDDVVVADAEDVVQDVLRNTRDRDLLSTTSIRDEELH